MSLRLLGFRHQSKRLSRSRGAKTGRRALRDTPSSPCRAPNKRATRPRASAAGEVFADESHGGEGPAGEDQVDTDQKADRPVGGAGELGKDQDADQQAGEAAEADQPGVRLAAAAKATAIRVNPMKRK